MNPQLDSIKSRTNRILNELKQLKREFKKNSKAVEVLEVAEVHVGMVAAFMTVPNLVEAFVNTDYHPTGA